MEVSIPNLDPISRSSILISVATPLMMGSPLTEAGDRPRVNSTPIMQMIKLTGDIGFGPLRLSME